MKARKIGKGLPVQGCRGAIATTAGPLGIHLYIPGRARPITISWRVVKRLEHEDTCPLFGDDDD